MTSVRPEQPGNQHTMSHIGIQSYMIAENRNKIDGLKMLKSQVKMTFKAPPMRFFSKDGAAGALLMWVRQPAPTRTAMLELIATFRTDILVRIINGDSWMIAGRSELA